MSVEAVAVKCAAFELKQSSAEIRRAALRNRPWPPSLAMPVSVETRVRVLRFWKIIAMDWPRMLVHTSSFAGSSRPPSACAEQSPPD